MLGIHSKYDVTEQNQSLNGVLNTIQTVQSYFPLFLPLFSISSALQGTNHAQFLPNSLSLHQGHSEFLNIFEFEFVYCTRVGQTDIVSTKNGQD